MNDLNFFVNPNARKEHTSISSILIILIVVVALAIAGLFWFMSDRNNKVRVAIEKLETQMASPEFIEGRKKVDMVNQQLSLLKKYDQALITIDSTLVKEDKIKKAFLDTTAAAIPPDITLLSMTLTSSDLMIEAFSTNETANAEYIRNLKDTGLFASVELLSVIQSEEDGAAVTDRNLTIHATLGEVMPE